MTEPDHPAVIPAFDYRRGLKAIRVDLDKAIARVLDSGQLILGPEVAAFEREFSEYTGAKHSIAVANGTDALILALRALQVGSGDEVVTVANGCVPTVAAIRATGAMPRFVDVDPDSLQLDHNLLDAAINDRTRAVIAVHLYGIPAAVDRIADVIAGRQIAIVEDCAQACGSQLNSGHAGTFGQIGCFSFYPTKNLGAFGDGGLCVTDDAALAESLRRQRMYGYDGDRVAHEDGLNSRLDEVQAAILRVKLRAIDAAIQRRCTIANQYMAGLKDSPFTLPQTNAGRSSWHQFVVRHARRDAIREHLGRMGVQTGIHYSTPVHRMPAYRDLETSGCELPVTEEACRTVISLPMFPELTDDEVERVISAMLEASQAVAG